MQVWFPWKQTLQWRSRCRGFIRASSLERGMRGWAEGWNRDAAVSRAGLRRETKKRGWTCRGVWTEARDRGPLAILSSPTLGGSIIFRLRALPFTQRRRGEPSSEGGSRGAHGLEYQVLGCHFSASMTPSVTTYQALPVDIFRLLI